MIPVKGNEIIRYVYLVIIHSHMIGVGVVMTAVLANFICCEAKLLTHIFNSEFTSKTE